MSSAANTDGTDTIRSSHIRFNNWTVYNGDDSIALKANSTDISITNSRFYNGLGIALGSIGQYKGQFETIERFSVKNVTFSNTLHAVSNPFLLAPHYAPVELTMAIVVRYTSRPGRTIRTATLPMAAGRSRM